LIMRRTLRATYSGKKFHPDAAPDLPEGSVVELEVHGPLTAPPTEREASTRSRIRDALVTRMLAGRLDPDAPRLTRDELHDRR
jgi:hypothetical protein